MVLGTPTTFMPLRKSSSAIAIFCEPSPPMLITASIPNFRALAMNLIRDVADDLALVLNRSVVKRIAAISRAKNSAAARQNAADVLQGEFVRLLWPDQA